MMTINQITREDLGAFDAKPTMNNYQRIATKSAIYPGKGQALGLIYVALKLNGEAGELAEHVGKSMRDDGFVKPISDDGLEQLMAPSGFMAGDMTKERRERIIKEIGDVLWYVSAACNEVGISLADAAAENLLKLCDRSERGKLQGEGDTR